MEHVQNSPKTNIRKLYFNLFIQCYAMDCTYNMFLIEIQIIFNKFEQLSICEKKPTIYDIASKLNITAATVSRALNDSELISKKTKKMVLESAHELSYFKNRHALALKSGRTNPDWFGCTFY